MSLDLEFYIRKTNTHKHDNMNFHSITWDGQYYYTVMEHSNEIHVYNELWELIHIIVQKSCIHLLYYCQWKSVFYLIFEDNKNILYKYTRELDFIEEYSLKIPPNYGEIQYIQTASFSNRIYIGFEYNIGFADIKSLTLQHYACYKDVILSFYVFQIKTKTMVLTITHIQDKYLFAIQDHNGSLLFQSEQDVVGESLYPIYYCNMDESSLMFTLLTSSSCYKYNYYSITLKEAIRNKCNIEKNNMNICDNKSISLEESLIEILHSIAQVETSIAHILSVESEKLQHTLAISNDIDAILCMNQEINKTIIHVTQLEQTLYNKLQLAISINPINNTCKYSNKLNYRTPCNNTSCNNTYDSTPIYPCNNIPNNSSTI